MRKTITVLGSTGSIGTQTLEVASMYGIKIHALSANRNISLLREQTEKFKPRYVVITDPVAYKTAVNDDIFTKDIKLLSGKEGLRQICADPVDMVVNALVGFYGLRSTLDIIQSGNDQAFANKESMVVFGEQIVALSKKMNTVMIPVDSEHSALFQCLAGEDKTFVSEMILTASGGPFVDMELSALANVTIEQTLAHPNWSMGRKITVDSATMMNKGLEVIEARYLFGIEPDRIKTVIHKESIIHSIVGFIDGSYKAQLSTPDMKLPIAYALFYPERSPAAVKALDFGTQGRLSFKETDMLKYPCLKLAYGSLECKNSMRVVLNAANEACVEAFLEGRISYLDIPRYIENMMSLHDDITINNYDHLLALNDEIRKKVYYATGGR